MAVAADTAGRPRPLIDAEFARGWPALIAVFLGLMFSMNTAHINTLGVVAPELVKEFGWTRSQVQSSFGVLMVTFMLASPVCGMLVQRFGPRKVVLISSPLLGLTFMSFALVNGSLLHFYGLMVMTAVLGLGTYPMGYALVVTQWFRRHTGLALGIALLSPGIVSAASVPLLMTVVENFGWRGVYLFGGAMPLIVWPILFLWFRSPPKAVLEEGPKTTTPTEGLPVKAALMDWRFWVIGAVLFTANGAMLGILTNLPTLLAERGLSRSEIMLSAPALGASAAIGRLIGGGLIDRWWAPAVAMFFLVTLAAGVWLIAQDFVTVKLIVLALVMIGFANGVEYDMLPYLVSRYFGLVAYPSIYAGVFICSGVGGSLGPIFFGMAYDQTGSFNVMLLGISGLLVAAGLALLTLGPYRYFIPAKKTETSPASA